MGPTYIFFFFHRLYIVAPHACGVLLEYKRYKNHVFYGCNMKKMVLFLATLAFLSGLASAETVKIAINSCCVTEDATVKEILPAFKSYYREKFGKDVDVSASFEGSGPPTTPK